MSDKWFIKKISDIIEVNPKESLLKGKAAKKISMDILRPFCRDISKYEMSEYSGGVKFRNGDTIMARITPCLENGKTAKVNILDDDEVGFGSTEYIVFRAKKEVTDEDFVYYLVCSPLIRDTAIKSMVGSSGRQRVQTDVIKSLELSLPDFNTQKRIGALLKSLDDRISVNTAINENLEQQAQALYRQMFVYADDNQSATIADISLNVTDGVHNTVKDDPDGSYLLLSCKNIKGGSLNIGSGERHINKETFDKLRKRTQLAKGDILISSVGTIGEILMLNTEPTYYEFQRSVAMIKPDTELVSSAYVYESLLYKKAELINAAHGAVQQCLFISDISEFPIDIPSKVKLDIFNSAVIPMFEIITANNEENQRLAALRDTLLPKLMNGEIDVSAVKI